jgi:hypothetical protein
MDMKGAEDKIRYLRQYLWSTYPSYAGRMKSFDFVEYGPVLSEMGGREKTWSRKYEEFVEDDVVDENEEFRNRMKKSPRSIGGDEFRAWVDELHEKMVSGRNLREDISFRRTTGALDVNVILRTVSERLGVKEDVFRMKKRDSALRGIAAKMLTRFGGQTQRQVASLLKMGTGGAVSAQVRKLPRIFETNNTLLKTTKKIEKELVAIKLAQSKTNKKEKKSASGS